MSPVAPENIDLIWSNMIIHIYIYIYIYIYLYILRTDGRMDRQTDGRMGGWMDRGDGAVSQ